MKEIDINSEYYVEEGHVCYYGISPHIIIPDGVQKIKSFNCNYSILSIVVPEGVKVIEDEVFAGSNGTAIHLEYIDLPDSIIEIHRSSFPFWEMAWNKSASIKCSLSTKDFILKTLDEEYSNENRWKELKKGLKWILV